MTTDALAPNASRFGPLGEQRAALWSHFGNWDEVFFPSYIGLEIEELRQDYCRMRLPFRDELRQPAGIMHGGAIATLLDTAVVPAIGGGYDYVPFMATLSMAVTYIGAATGDIVGEGFIVRRGGSIVNCRSEVRNAADASLCATADLVYKVGKPR